MTACAFCGQPSMTDLCVNCEREANEPAVQMTDVGVNADAPPTMNGSPPRQEPPEEFVLLAETARAYCARPDRGTDAYLLGPLVRRGERTILVADTGHGKTTFGLQSVSAIVNGIEMLGYTGSGAGPALVLDLEQGERSIKRSLRDAGLSESDLVHVVSVPDGLALDKEFSHYAAVRRLLAEYAPTVLLLDPYYKAHRADDPNAERPIVDLMRKLDALRTEFGFALLMPAHPRKEMSGKSGPRKLTLHDVAGSGAVTRGAEVVLGIERLNHGYARLRILKDRDGELEVGVAWPLLFDRDGGYRRDPKADAPPRDLLGELEAYLTEHPGATTNRAAEGIAAGKAKVSELLMGSDRFEYRPGPNNSRLWRVTRSGENHSGHRELPEVPCGDPTSDPSLEGHVGVTSGPGDPTSDPIRYADLPSEQQAELDYLEAIYEEASEERAP